MIKVSRKIIMNVKTWWYNQDITYRNGNDVMIVSHKFLELMKNCSIVWWYYNWDIKGKWHDVNDVIIVSRQFKNYFFCFKPWWWHHDNFKNVLTNVVKNDRIIWIKVIYTSDVKIHKQIKVICSIIILKHKQIDHYVSR